jgi:hypothetical protein
MDNFLPLVNIFLSVTGVLMLFVGFFGEIRYMRMAEKTSLKLLWVAILMMVGVFIFGFSSFSLALILQLTGRAVPLGTINVIVSFTFLTGGIWMASMIILEYRIVQSAETKAESAKLIEELERQKLALDEKVIEQTKDIANRVREMENIEKNLIERELEMVEIKNEISRIKNNGDNIRISVD